MNAKRRLRALLVVALSGAACNRSGGTVEHTAIEDAPRVDTGEKAESAAKADTNEEGTPQPRLPIGKLELSADDAGTIALQVEIASKPSEQQIGMMFRKHMAENEGMLFVFPTERYNSFWMRNTLIPLDMFFIDSEWNVVGVVENARPRTDSPRRVGRMSQYVLEVNAGFAARHQLGVGTRVKFEPPQTLELP